MPEAFHIKQLADEMRVMQEALYRLPLSEVRAHIEAMERHAIKLSRLASRLDGQEHEWRIRRENEIPLIPKCDHVSGGTISNDA